MMLSNRVTRADKVLTSTVFIYYRLLDNNHLITIPVEAKKIFDKIADKNGSM